MLAGEDYGNVVKHSNEAGYVDMIRAICGKLLANSSKSQTVIVTGIIRRDGDREFVGNLAVSHNEWFYVEDPYIGKGFSGTGDLFASVICGSLMNGLSLKEALEKASNFLTEAIEEAAGEGVASTHGVLFEKHLSKLLL